MAGERGASRKQRTSAHERDKFSSIELCGACALQWLMGTVAVQSALDYEDRAASATMRARLGALTHH